MKRIKLFGCISIFLLCFLFTACKKKTICEKNGHQWQEATCTAPKTCSVCKTTEGVTLEHQYQEATCIRPKTCSVCHYTVGESLGHNFSEIERNEATCTIKGNIHYNCTRCDETKNEEIPLLEHSWLDATYLQPQTCKSCGLTQGLPLPSVWVKVIDGKQEMALNETQTLKFNFAQNMDVEAEILDEDILEIISIDSNQCIIQSKKMGTTKIRIMLVDHSQYDEIEITVTEENFTVTFLEKTNVTVPSSMTYKTSELPLVLPEASRTNFHFLGWMPKKDYDGNVLTDQLDLSQLWHSIPENVAEDIELVPIMGYTRLEFENPTTIIDLETGVLLTVKKMYFPETLQNCTLKWESKDTNILTIDENGFITPMKEGYTTVQVSVMEKPTLNLTIGITIVSNLAELDDVIQFLIRENREQVIAQTINVVGYQFNYSHKLLGSVSDFLFREHVVDESIPTPVGASNRPGDVYEKYYITVHDTASTINTADARTHATYVKNGGGGTSWHYSAGDTGIYHQIPDDERAYHAGDGSQAYHLNETGVVVKENSQGVITISSDGYYEIDGEKTLIQVPRKEDGTIPTTADINDEGIRLVIEDGKYLIGDTWWSSTYKKISNTGGNCNSIGIETMVNQGSDLYMTWQRTAKLVAHLLVDNHLSVDDVKPHHYFSGKNCPETMRNNGLWDNFIELVKAEYEYLTQYASYTFSCKSLDITYLDNYGRVKKQNTTDYYVSYTITITKDEEVQTITLTSLIPGTSRQYKA